MSATSTGAAEVPPHLEGREFARIPTAQYARAQQLAKDLDELLHRARAEIPFSNGLAAIFDAAHGMVHDLTHAMVDVDSPDHTALHPEASCP